MESSSQTSSPAARSYIEEYGKNSDHLSQWCTIPDQWNFNVYTTTTEVEALRSKLSDTGKDIAFLHLPVLEPILSLAGRTKLTLNAYKKSLKPDTFLGEAGIFISSCGLNFLEASLDGLVCREEKTIRLVEVKCPYKECHSTVWEMCSDGPFYCALDSKAEAHT